jgi:hypothetical protein
MANALQLRRGTTTEHGSFTGLAGEITVDTTKDTLVIHDGSTAGGIPLAKESAITSALTASDILTSISTVDGAGSGLDADTLDGKQLATLESEYQTFANNAAAAVVDSAPSTLDTLNELAAALGDDANFSTTVTNSIATKMPLAGGTFTGDINMGSNDITTTGKVLYSNVYSALGDLPSASTYHGMFAHVHGTGKGYYAHGGNWIELANFDTSGNLIVDGTLDIEEVLEHVETSVSTTSTITIEATDGAVWYFTANQTANRTINFRGNSGLSLNSLMNNNQSMTFAISMTQGSTAYYLNAYQIDGSTVTPKWSGGEAPTEGSASGIDVYTFTIIKTADATFTVLASVTQFA